MLILKSIRVDVVFIRVGTNSKNFRCLFNYKISNSIF